MVEDFNAGWEQYVIIDQWISFLTAPLLRQVLQ